MSRDEYHKNFMSAQMRPSVRKEAQALAQEIWLSKHHICIKHEVLCISTANLHTRQNFLSAQAGFEGKHYKI